jgi:hypothetical protein
MGRASCLIEFSLAPSAATTPKTACFCCYCVLHFLSPLRPLIPSIIHEEVFLDTEKRDQERSQERKEEERRENKKETFHVDGPAATESTFVAYINII